MVAAVVKKKRAAGTLAGMVIVNLVIATSLALAPGRRAEAHPEVSPQLVNRYLSVMVLGDRLEYFITLLYGQLPAGEERKRLDSDGDRQIASDELDRAAAAWKGRAAELARLDLDGRPIDLAAARASVQLGAEQGVTSAPLVVEIYGATALASGTHQIRLEPGWDPPRAGETELSLDLSPDWTLMKSRSGHGPEGQARLFRFEGPRPSEVADRSATFTIGPAPARSSGSRLTLVAAAIAAAAGIALALELRRRQRRRPGSQLS